jgi:hypothetical protein
VPEALPATTEHAEPPSCGWITPLSPEQASALWAPLHNVLKPALDRLSWQYASEDVRRLLEEGRFGAFVAEESGEIRAALIVEVLRYPRCRVLSIVALAGIGDGHWTEWLEIISAYARAMACRYIVTFGARPGWQRVVKDMQSVGHTMLLDLNKEFH